MELLPVAELACYWWHRPRIEEIEPFTVGATTLATADEETDEGADDEVEERPHRPIVPGRSQRESAFLTPTGCGYVAAAPGSMRARSGAGGNQLRPMLGATFGAQFGASPMSCDLAAPTKERGACPPSVRSQPLSVRSTQSSHGQESRAILAAQPNEKTAVDNAEAPS